MEGNGEFVVPFPYTVKSSTVRLSECLTPSKVVFPLEHDIGHVKERGHRRCFINCVGPTLVSY